MTDPRETPSCTCDTRRDLADAFAGRPVAPCPQHRPEPVDGLGLLTDADADGLAEALATVLGPGRFDTTITIPDPDDDLPTAA